MEKWLDVRGYENYYQVSNFGRVRSKDREHKGCYDTKQIKKGRIMTLGNSFGYKQIGLTDENGRRTFIKIHRLVIGTFSPMEGFEYKKNECHKKIQVDHIDNNKSNNKLENLQYVSASENVKKCFKDGRKTWNEGIKTGIPAWNRGIKTGIPAWNRGIPMSEEQKLKISETKLLRQKKLNT